jgi:hypothetical protein
MGRGGMTIAIGSNFMTFTIDQLYHLWSPLWNITKGKEGGLDFEATEKGEDALHIGHHSALASIPGRGGKNVFDITDVMPVFRIHRQYIFYGHIPTLLFILEERRGTVNVTFRRML